MLKVSTGLEVRNCTMIHQIKVDSPNMFLLKAANRYRAFRLDASGAKLGSAGGGGGRERETFISTELAARYGKE
jgi:hypothetical protein